VKQFNGYASFFVTPPRHDEPQGQEGGLKRKEKKRKENELKD
jgi:hypothetical protein